MYTSTNNFDIPLIKEYQTKKDQSINKSFIFMDSLINRAIDLRVWEFKKDKYSDLSSVIEETTNLIHFKIDNEWHKIKAKKGMLFFVVSENYWFYFDGIIWKEAG